MPSLCLLPFVDFSDFDCFLRILCFTNRRLKCDKGTLGTFVSGLSVPRPFGVLLKLNSSELSGQEHTAPLDVSPPRPQHHESYSPLRLLPRIVRRSFHMVTCT